MDGVRASSVSHFPFNSESIQIKSLKRFTWTLKGIDIFSAGTLAIVMWSIEGGGEEFKMGQPVL